MKKLTLSLLLAAILLSACSTLGGSELSKARSRWQASRATHYRFDLRVVCFCAFVEKMPLTIEVRDNQVLTMVYKDGTPVSAEERQYFQQYETIDKLFDFTAESQKKADDIQIAYDATYGFPRDVQIDFIRLAADDELSLQVSDYQPMQ